MAMHLKFEIISAWDSGRDTQILPWYGGKAKQRVLPGLHELLRVGRYDCRRGITLGSLQKKISKAYKTFGKDHEVAHHAILKDLRNRNIRTMDLAEVANAYSYLRHNVMEQAEAKNAFLPGSEGGGREVDERFFPAEITQLRQLATRLNYSPRLTDWMAEKRHAFKNELTRDPQFNTALKNWPGMSPNERASFIKDLVVRRTRSFSDRNFQFSPPEILIEDMGENRLGRARPRENEILLNKSLFEQNDPAEAIAIAFHEGTHNLLTQFAIAFDQGQIKIDNPLATDIRIAHAQNFYGGPSSSCFPSLYDIDNEENLCYHEENVFAYELANGNGLRAKFKIAGQIINDVLHGHPPTVKQAVQMLQMK